MAKATQKRDSSSGPDAGVVENVRDACIRAAVEGYENASISGLCGEGAFEAAISAIRMLDLDGITKSRSGTGN